MYRSWIRAMPPGVELHPVQLPGREELFSETPFRSVGPLIAWLARRLDGLGAPAAFFGHSMGSLIAFEMAHRLRAITGREPAHLFVSARRAPHLPSARPPLHDLPEAEFRAGLRQLGGTPDEVLAAPELLELMTPMLRADLELDHSYKPAPGRPALGCPVTAFGGEDDRLTVSDHLRAWSQVTTGRFRLRLFPGDHWFFRQAGESLVTALREELAPYLEASRESPASEKEEGQRRDRQHRQPDSVA